MAAPELIVESTLRFLRDHVPFATMARADLEFLASRARVAYFPAGTTIVDAATGAGDALHVIQRGHVRSADPSLAGTDVVLGPGECFPLVRLAADTAGGGTFTATEDVFCLQLARDDFVELRRRSVPFAEFCAAALATIVQQSVAQLRQDFGQRAIEQQTLLQPLSALVRREPVWCPAGTSLREALDRMRGERVGTIVVADAERRPLGIFTLTDLLDRVVLADVPLDAPVDEVMTPHPGAVDELASAQDALALMAERGYHQVMVTRGHELVGVVSERDLFALQRVSMRNVLESVRTAADVPQLADAMRAIERLTDNLVAQGAAAGPLTHTIASLHDAVARRLFQLLAPAHALDDVEWCWLALGSEGRREQTAASDQDNALVFRTSAPDPASARARLLAFGRAANAALAALGVPLCSGNVMAGNPDCCLSLQEWHERFASWVREPTPQALLSANIWFDFRALHGTVALAERLRAYVGGIAADGRLFLRMLTTNALQAEPPLGVIRAFRTDDGPDGGTIDLKTQGTRLFVDAARVLALGTGVDETNTAQRLRLAGRRLAVPARDVDAAVEAFEFLQMLRLRVQRGLLVGTHNSLRPYALNALDQRLLKEALRQARALQQLVERTFGQ